MNKINNHNILSGFRKHQFVIPMTIAMIFAIFGKNSFGGKMDNLSLDVGTEIFENINGEKKLANIMNTFNSNIDQEQIAKFYLESNLFVNGKIITDPQFNSRITVLGDNKYQIKYQHMFEGIAGISDPASREITMKIKFNYKDNNIFIDFEEVSIQGSMLDDNGTLLLSGVVYDYDISNPSQGGNKAIEINLKKNPYKTDQMIVEKIKGKDFRLLSNFQKINEFENTQFTKLNDVSLGKEIIKDGDFFYREVFVVEGGKYMPITRVYFDKKGDFNLAKTNSFSAGQEKFKILGVDITFELNLRGNNFELKFSDESINKLKDKIEKHRKKIIEIIDKSKVGSNLEFTGFNKINGVRAWSDGDNRWGFNTELVSLQLIDNKYIFQWGTREQKIYFGIEHVTGGDDNIIMLNDAGKKVDEYFVETRNDKYKLVFDGEKINIHVVKNLGSNGENLLPNFSGDQNLVNLLSARDVNIYYNDNKKTMEYWTSEGVLLTSIACEKSEQGEYTLKENSINIDILDLYNDNDFRSIVSSIKNKQKKLNTLDVDIVDSFRGLLLSNGIVLENQDLLKITDKTGKVYYSKIRSRRGSFEIKKDEKLYNTVEKTLKQIDSRLDLIEKLNNTKVFWQNNNQKQDFTKFVAGSWGAGRRSIGQSNILSFVTGATNEINLNLLWGEGQITTITYDVSPKSLKVKLSGRNVKIGGQDYKIKLDDKWNIVLHPIRIRR